MKLCLRAISLLALFTFAPVCIAAPVSERAKRVALKRAQKSLDEILHLSDTDIQRIARERTRQFASWLGNLRLKANVPKDVSEFGEVLAFASQRYTNMKLNPEEFGFKKERLYWRAGAKLFGASLLVGFAISQFPQYRFYFGDTEELRAMKLLVSGSFLGAVAMGAFSSITSDLNDKLINKEKAELFIKTVVLEFYGMGIDFTKILESPDNILLHSCEEATK